MRLTELFPSPRGSRLHDLEKQLIESRADINYLQTCLGSIKTNVHSASLHWTVEKAKLDIHAIQVAIESKTTMLVEEIKAHKKTKFTSQFKIAKLLKENKKMQKKLDDYSALYNKWSATFTKNQQAVESLEEENKALRAEGRKTEELEQKLATTEAERDEARKETSTRDAENYSLTVENTMLKGELEHSVSTHLYQGAIKEHAIALKTQGETSNGLKQKLAVAEAERDEARKETSIYNDEKYSLTVENTMLKGELKHSVSTHLYQGAIKEHANALKTQDEISNGLKQKLAAAEAERDEARKETSTRDDEKYSLTVENTMLKGELKHSVSTHLYRGAIKEHANALKTQGEVSNGLKQKLAAAEAERDEARKETSIYNDEKYSLTVENTMLKGELKHSVSIHLHRGTIKEHKEALKKQDEVINVLKQKLAVAEAERDEARKETSTRDDEKYSLTVENTMLKGELKHSVSTHLYQGAIKEHTNALKTQDETSNGFKQKLAVAEAERDEARKETSIYNDEKYSLTVENTMLKGELKHSVSIHLYRGTIKEHSNALKVQTEANNLLKQQLKVTKSELINAKSNAEWGMSAYNSTANQLQQAVFTYGELQGRLAESLTSEETTKQALEATSCELDTANQELETANQELENMKEEQVRLERELAEARNEAVVQATGRRMIYGSRSTVTDVDTDCTNQPECISCAYHLHRALLISRSAEKVAYKAVDQAGFDRMKSWNELHEYKLAVVKDREVSTPPTSPQDSGTAPGEESGESSGGEVSDEESGEASGSEDSDDESLEIITEK